MTTKPQRPAGPLAGKEVAITGRLASMDRSEAVRLLKAAGAHYNKTPGTQTHYLIVGEAGWPLRNDGRLTHHIESAQRLQSSGHAIAVISESELLSQLGRAEEGVRRFYTAHQLARILNLPPARITTWIRQGLIEPVKVLNRLRYFSFSQVASAKALSDLIGAGIAPSRLRKSLEQMKGWWPAAPLSLTQLDLLDRGDLLLLRLRDGSLAEPTGQLHFSFEPPAAPEQRIPSRGNLAFPPESKEELFLTAIQLEEQERLDEAVTAYHEALLVGGPNPETAFNFGNALYRLGRIAESVQRFMQAVELDPSYVEAWNNLGNAESEVGRHHQAVRAFHRALTIHPGYADAHYNLGETLHHLGQREEAREHWRAYLDLDPHSTWAEHVRERLDPDAHPTPG